MFWGLIMEPKRRYTQKVKHPFHISMAALDIFSADDEPTQLMLHFEERNYLLCTLQKGHTMQIALDLNFEAGDEVVFATNGHSNVHLSGYLQEDLDEYLEEQDEEEEAVKDVKIDTRSKKRKVVKSENQFMELAAPTKKSKLAELLNETYDSDDDESFALPEDEEEEADSSEDEEDAEEDEEEEDDDEDIEDEEEESDEEVSSLSENEEEEIQPKQNGVANKRQTKKQLKLLQNEQKSPKPTNKAPKPEKAPKLEKTPGKQEKGQKLDNSLKANKTPKGEKTPKGNKTPTTEGKMANQQSPSQKRNLEGGVIVQDLKVGDGAVVKQGKMVQVYYEGRLKQNNKVFDQNSKGSGFKFRLGKQEVIKGWDVGLNGMKVGGKRRIICPPNMAYGNRGSPPVIPPNSTLVFDVELKNII